MAQRQLVEWRAFREDGSCIYSGKFIIESTEQIADALAFYTSGHPKVFGIKVTVAPIAEPVEVALQVDRSPELVATWDDRRGELERLGRRAVVGL